jgi:RNA polymerase sigma-70 factor (ECF subfamily)
VSGDDEALATFELERPRLLGLAYRMLGSISDAEDVMQEAWLRWQLADRSPIERPTAWLTTVTSRCCLDRMRVTSRRREDYVGPWLPEPVAVQPGPDEVVEMADTLTLGFLVILDRLNPVERLVFLLADVFGVRYREIAEITGRSEAGCRQIAHRARTSLAAEPVSPPPSDADDILVARLMAAVLGGDVAGTVALLAPDVMLVSDGGRDHRAARRPVVTPGRVARLLINLAKRADSSLGVQPCRLNGRIALVFNDGEAPRMALVFETKDAQVRRIWAVLAPDKLAHLSEPTRIR